MNTSHIIRLHFKSVKRLHFWSLVKYTCSNVWSSLPPNAKYGVIRLGVGRDLYVVKSRERLGGGFVPYNTYCFWSKKQILGLYIILIFLTIYVFITYYTTKRLGLLIVFQNWFFYYNYIYLKKNYIILCRIKYIRILQIFIFIVFFDIFHELNFYILIITTLDAKLIYIKCLLYYTIDKTCTNLVNMFCIIPINLRFIKFVSNIVNISCKTFQNDLDTKRVREYKVF